MGKRNKPSSLAVIKENDMKLGDIAYGRDIGRTSSAPHQWTACSKCGKERWVRLHKKKLYIKNNVCFTCHSKASIKEAHRIATEQAKKLGKPAMNWKTGRTVKGDGYIQVKLQRDDFFYPMTNRDRYVTEHRLVMAKYMGRCLHRWEIVHHRNGVRLDNSLENLQLVDVDKHSQITILERRVKQLEERVIILEAENVAMRTERCL